MKRKIVFLVLALVLPAGVFVFLKMFGRNEFQVPVLHQHGTIERPKDCPAEFVAPYRVPDSVMTSLKLNRKDSLFVFYFDASMNTAIKRVAVEFGDAPVHIVSPRDIPAHMDAKLIRECILLMPADSSVALLDHRNRIRGYYDGADRDEIDRLIVEMKIILKQY